VRTRLCCLSHCYIIWDKYTAVYSALGAQQMVMIPYLKDTQNMMVWTVHINVCSCRINMNSHGPISTLLKAKKRLDCKYPQSNFWCLDATENEIFLKLFVLLEICLK